MSPPAQGEPDGWGRAALRELAAEHAPDPLLLTQQGEVSWISDSIADCLGWSAADLGQARLMHLCHHQDQGALTALLDSAAGGGIHRAVVRMRSKDDPSCWRGISYSATSTWPAPVNRLCWTISASADRPHRWTA